MALLQFMKMRNFRRFFAILLILFQSRLISYNMGEKLTKFCNFAKWQRLAVFMVNLWVLFDTRWAFTFNTSRNRIIEMWWLRNSENQFLIFGICVAYIWETCEIYTSARSTRVSYSARLEMHRQMLFTLLSWTNRIVLSWKSIVTLLQCWYVAMEGT